MSLPGVVHVLDKDKKIKPAGSGRGSDEAFRQAEEGASAAIPRKANWPRIRMWMISTSSCSRRCGVRGRGRMRWRRRSKRCNGWPRRPTRKTPRRDKLLQGWDVVGRIVPRVRIPQPRRQQILRDVRPAGGWFRRRTGRATPARIYAGRECVAFGSAFSSSFRADGASGTGTSVETGDRRS